MIKDIIKANAKPAITNVIVENGSSGVGVGVKLGKDDGTFEGNWEG
tara:strand:+ start:109 stop:246 length:138 start_codon:yes stop_codon:yes gene_type:complete